MFCRNVFSDLCINFNSFVDYKYVNSDVAFKRSGKFSLSSAIKYPLCTMHKTTSLDANRFLRKELGDDTVNITKQGISDRMQYIDPRVYIDMNDTAIKQLYDNIEEMTSFKDFVVCAVDASIIEIPNVPLTREEFEIPENTKLESYKSSARISCMVDTQKDFVLSSNISYKDMSELEHAIFHLKEVSNKLDLTKTITVYDRGYNATEIMLLTTLLDSYFVIRAKKSTFKKQQEKMKTNDETFKISLNNSKINRFHNNELKEYARILKSMKIRIVKVKLNNGTTETLITNIPEEIAQSSELKELYGDRWTVEKDFDRLKNKLQIEKFTGRKKIRVEQDFVRQDRVSILL